MSLERLDSKTAYKLLTEGIIVTAEDLKKYANRWILHCIYSGLAAEGIAKKLGLDSDYAKALGYIHDIGRRICHPRHPIEGYKYMKEKGYGEEGKICLTHSFIDNDITLATGPFPKKEAYDFLKPYLVNKKCDIYDNIIQLCDLFCLETGFTTIEKRILDISLRKGIYPSSKRHFLKTLELKERIEKELGCELYDLFDEISKEDLDNANKCQEELLKLFLNVSFNPINIALDITEAIQNSSNNSVELSFNNSELGYITDKLLREGHKIYLLCFGNTNEKSLNTYLNNSSINSTEIISSKNLNKVKVCREKEIDVIITNDKSFSDELNENGLLVIFISSEISSENNSSFIEIKTWEELPKVINILSSTSKNDEKYRKMLKNNIKST